MFVLLFLQIVAMAKTPKFCKMFMNLSLEQIVNLGEALVQSGMGMAKMAGGLALGGAALAAGAAGGMAMKGLGKVGGSAASKLGNSSIGKSIRDKVRGFSDDDPMGGSGGSGFGGGSLSRGGSPSLEKTALADTNMKASTSNKSSVLKKEEDKKDEDKKDESSTPKTAMDEKKESWDKKMKMLSGAKDGASSFLEKMNESRKNKGLTLGNIADKGYDMVWGAMEEGAGMGSNGATKMLETGLKSANDSVNSQTARDGAVQVGGQIVDESANTVGSLKDRLFKSEPKLSSSERSMMAEQVFQNSAFMGKQKTSEQDNAQLSQNLQAIATGQADQSQFLQVMQAQNTKNLSKDQMKQIADVRKNNAQFNKFANSEEARNQSLLSNIQKEFIETGSIGDKSLGQLSSLTSAGMVDLDQVSNLKVNPGGPEGSNPYSLAEAMQYESRNQMDAVIEGFEGKLAKGQSLNQSELNTAIQLFENQKSSLVGDKGRVSSFDNILSNQIDSSHLLQSREKTMENIGRLAKGLENSSSQTVSITPVLNLIRNTINEQGVERLGDGFQGLMINNTKVASQEDYNNLSSLHKKYIDDLSQKMELATKDKATGDGINSKLEQDFINSNEFKNLKAFVASLKK